jgi:hypothetical protein
MNWDGRLYKPEVAWRTTVREAVLISAATTLLPAVYQVTVVPDDNTDPGASAASKAVNFNILDYLGHIYRMIEISIGGNSSRVKVSDDFRWGQSPQNGKQAIVYKSVGGGFAPWLAATYGTHLASTAANTAAGIDNAILWKTGESVLVTNTDEPKLIDYQTNYVIPYGNVPRPKVKLFQFDEVGGLIERSERPYFTFVGDDNITIDTITFGSLEKVGDWIIEISR